MFLIFGMEVRDPVVLPVDRDDNAKKRLISGMMEFLGEAIHERIYLFRNVGQG